MNSPWRNCNTFRLCSSHRDPELNAVYEGTADVRHVPRELEVTVREWESLNAEVARDPEPARLHRDGHCREGVMWYVHHLLESMKEVLKDKASLPPALRRFAAIFLWRGPMPRTCRVITRRRVTCASCHSAVRSTHSF